MNDYWGVPEKEYKTSMMQFAKKELKDSGYSIIDEKVEVCSGAGALTLTAILKRKDAILGLYLHDGPRQRKKRGTPLIKILALLPEMKNVEDLRKFVITHPDNFHTILRYENTYLRNKVRVDILKIYSHLYDLKVRDLYETNLSSAAETLRFRLKSEDEFD